MSQQYRLITRSDFDGLVSAVLLKELGMIKEIMFVHPKDMQDGKIVVTDQDIITNLPYVDDCHLCFDHHESETQRVAAAENYIIDAKAPSAARVVYDHYGGAEAFPHISPDLITAVDKSDSANYSLEDILNPINWVLLSFIMDSRTGLGRFRNFRISNYQLMMNLIDYCRNMTVGEIIALPDVQERVALYNEHQKLAREQIARCAKLDGKIIQLDFSNEPVIYAANRFLGYALFPDAQVSIHLVHNNTKDKMVYAVGKSIINRSLSISIGNLMLELGGGGHDGAGTCQIDYANADTALSYIISRLKA